MVLKMNTHLFPSLFSFYMAISMAKQQVGTPFVFKKDDIFNVVAGHNHLRTHNATPVASDMRRMTWDKELAYLSSSWTTRCKYEIHREVKVARWKNLGQSFYMSEPGGNWTNEFHFQPLLKWLYQKRNYIYGNHTCKENAFCIEYMNLMSSKTYKVGCGASHCKDMIAGADTVNEVIFYMCLYGPQVNTSRNEANRLYTAGEACSTCEENDTCTNDMCTDPDRDAEFEFEADSSNSGATSGIVAGSVVGVLVVGGVATAAFVYYKKLHKISPENEKKVEPEELEERIETGDGNSCPSSPVVDEKNLANNPLSKMDEHRAHDSEHTCQTKRDSKKTDAKKVANVANEQGKKTTAATKQGKKTT